MITDKNFSSAAIHESGHFIMCLCNGFGKEIKCVNTIENEILDGFVIRFGIDISFTEYNDFSKEQKKIVRLYLKNEIQYSLAGYASEAIASGYGNKWFKLSGILMKLHDRKDPDILRAVAINIRLGNQTERGGAYLLLQSLNAAIKCLKYYWGEVEIVASLLDEHKILEGNKLEEIKQLIMLKMIERTKHCAIKRVLNILRFRTLTPASKGKKK